VLRAVGVKEELGANAIEASAVAASASGTKIWWAARHAKKKREWEGDRQRATRTKWRGESGATERGTA
jgi:hypothetical protein